MLLGISLFACNKNDDGVSDTPNKEFDAYVEALPAKLYSATDYQLNFIFADKEAAGYADEMYEFSLPDRKAYDKSLEEMNTIYDEIKKFERSSLTADQQLTYDVLLDSFNTDTSVSDTSEYYLSTNYLDTVYGVPSNLPLNFYFYKFRTQSDVDSYLNLLKTSDDYFMGLAKHEQERQDEGFGMTPTQVKAAIQQCDDFIAANKDFLISSFEEKINGLEGLSDQQRAEYSKLNETYITENFTKAYTDLKVALEDLNVKTKKDEGYASIYKDGKQYYEELIYAYTGFDDMDDYKEYLEDKREQYLNEFIEALSADATLQSRLTSGTLEFTSATTPQEVLNELEAAMVEDFPEVRDIAYDMEIVPESMQDIFSAAAAYFPSPVDDKNAKELMILNSEYNQDSFLTIAHEGFPGHLYQIQYYKDTDAPMIRQLLDYDGYTEGYANYVEQYSAKYAKDVAGAEAWTDYQRYMYAEILLLDIMIHYEGLSEKEVKKEIVALYGSDLSDEDMSSIYEQLLHTPALFAKYYGAGFRLEDLKEAVKDEVGSNYTDEVYHKALLEVGPAPYRIVKDYVLNHVNEK